GGQQGADVVGDVHRVAAQAAKDGDHDRVAAFVADGLHAVLVQDAHVGEVADTQGLIVPGGNHQLLDVVGGRPLRVDEDLEGQRLPLDAADRLQAVGLADGVGQVGGGHAGGQQIVGPDFDLDLAHVAAIDVGVQDVGHVLDLRGQLEEGVIAELGR